MYEIGTIETDEVFETFGNWSNTAVLFVLSKYRQSFLWPSNNELGFLISSSRR